MITRTATPRGESVACTVCRDHTWLGADADGDAAWFKGRHERKGCETPPSAAKEKR